MSKIKHIPWTKIQHFNEVHHINKIQNKLISYKAKIKLHGTNAGIVIANDGSIIVQSRTQKINVQNDNYDFAKYVKLHEDKFKTLSSNQDIVIFGEWCGKGIQKGVAVSQVDRFFAVFAILIPLEDKIIIEPNDIKSMLSSLNIDNLHIIPWFNDNAIQLEFNEQHSLHNDCVLNNLNNLILDIEKCDPWAKAIFDIEGIGEGLVFYPLTDSYEVYKDFVFKAKGELHRTSACKKIQVKSDITNEIDFVKLVLTESRLNQGALHILGESLNFSKIFIKDFLHWIIDDILSECQEELSTLNVDVVKKECSRFAASWFIKKC